MGNRDIKKETKKKKKADVSKVASVKPMAVSAEPIVIQKKKKGE